jgi:hypothetical protein
VVLLTPLLLGLWMVQQQRFEDGVLARTEAGLSDGKWEAALAAFEPLASRRFLSSSARRRGAAVAFRLGEDRTGHRLLRGQRFDSKDPADARLSDLANRSLRAAALMRKADEAKSPSERVRLLRQAREELPESPRLLQRTAREELVLSVRDAKSPAGVWFEEDYMQLRLAAPKLAAELQREAQSMAGEVR